MIKKLRNQFIIISMSAVIMVLFTIVVVINIWNYVKMNQSINEVLGVLSDNGGYFPKNFLDNSFKEEPKLLRRDFKMGKETPFSTRYFSVNLDEIGNIITINTKDVVAISTETAKKYANEIFIKGKESGFIDNYKYKLSKDDSGYLLVVVDSSKELETFKDFLIISVSVMVIGIFSVFVVIVCVSKKAIKPILESYEKQKRFITDASHELKTPLTIIDSCTDMIEIESKEKSEWIESIKKQVKRLAYLINNLTLLAKMDENINAEKIKTEFSLTDAINETIENYICIIKSKGKQLECNIDKNISYIGNETEIRTVIDIVMDNAVKYSSKNASIKITLKEEGKYKVITIYNDVDEIQKGNLEILFERFYRIDSSRNSKTGGSGIGLSIAKAIVTSYKGSIVAKSSDGKSIEFKINLI